MDRRCIEETSIRMCKGRRLGEGRPTTSRVSPIMFLNVHKAMVSMSAISRVGPCVLRTCTANLEGARDTHKEVSVEGWMRALGGSLASSTM